MQLQFLPDMGPMRFRTGSSLLKTEAVVSERRRFFPEGGKFLQNGTDYVQNGGNDFRNGTDYRSERGLSLAERERLYLERARFSI